MNLDKFYKDIAVKVGLTDKQVKEIFESQFYFARQAMREGVKNDPESFKNINFIRFGKLYANTNYIKRFIKIEEDKLKRKQKEENGQERSSD